MSNNNVESTPVELPVTLDSVSIGMKRQQKQMLALATLCVVSVPSALLALVLMITDPEPETIETPVTASELRVLQSRLTDIESGLSNVLAAASQTQEELAALAQQVGTLDAKDGRNAIVRLQSLVVRQEQDFQKFLTTLEAGLYNFHMMIPHSRVWWDAYKTDLMASVEQSKARELSAGTLREIEPQGINQ